MADRRRRRRKTMIPLNDRIVLNAWVLEMFGVESTTDLIGLIGDAEAEGIDAEGFTYFCELLKAHLHVKQRAANLRTC